MTLTPEDAETARREGFRAGVEAALNARPNAPSTFPIGEPDEDQERGINSYEMAIRALLPAAPEQYSGGIPPLEAFGVNTKDVLVGASRLLAKQIVKTEEERDQLKAENARLRQLLIDNAIEACTECSRNGGPFPKRADCEVCASHVDDRLAALEPGHD